VERYAADGYDFAMDKPSVPKDPIPLPEAAKLADVTPRYMLTLVKSGRVEGVQIGRNYIVSEASARAFQRTKSEGRPRAKSSAHRKKSARRRK
jgi:hypothetical protein